MMLYPPMSELAAKAGSRYLLVNLVARRARNIAAAAQAAGEPLDTKPVSMAIDEVYDGRLHPWSEHKPGRGTSCADEWSRA